MAFKANRHAHRALRGPPGNVIRAADWATTQGGKEDLYRQVADSRGEGVVFKQAHSTYRAGRKPTGWPWLKCKFVATATLLAGPQTDRRSVELFSYEGTRLSEGRISQIHKAALEKMTLALLDRTRDAA